MSYFKKIFESHSGVSSKRVFGALGWIIVLGVAVYCTIVATEAPKILTEILYCSAALLGVDSITGIWKNSTNKYKEPEETDL